MLFNSFNFLYFLIVVFLLYWTVAKNRPKLQNLILLASSYFFYACWDWRFLFLIILSSSIDFFAGIMIEKSKHRQVFLLLSIVSNLGILFFFKYYNFFIDSFSSILANIGIHNSYSSLNIILPIGISFYTFQTLSYSIDVYRKNLTACKDPVIFFTFVSFFPQLVAGPIERATNLLPQFKKANKFNEPKAIEGFEQILWGLFKKVVIADNAGLVVNQIFENSQELGSISLLIGCVLFSFQIYGDFSGYSDMAIGMAKLFNIDLMINFKKPYFSRDLGEFWRRWHISLSTWFKDYVYIPLGGNQGSNFKTFLNISAVFLISGLWHGADLKFIFWGALHALYFLPLILIKKHRKYTQEKFYTNYSLIDYFKMLTTFLLVSVSWIPFRADSFADSILYFKRLFTDLKLTENIVGAEILIYMLCFLLLEWFTQRNEYPFQNSKLKVLKFIFFFIIVSLIFDFGIETKEFIYFQF